jgi:CDP-diacylglycerol--glycerol-3-phosphate 3-phosphatidyltransferase
MTLARLLLLPIPVAMVYQDSMGWRLAALAIFVVLGLTDAVDGMLARRYGATPLGELLDPIVDKIFLAATYVPLADLRVVWPSLVVVLFIRELAVTALRSIALEENVKFRTSRIAKLKTTVQMAGSAFIFLVWLFPDDRVITWILGVSAAASLVPLIVQLAARRRPDWRAVWGALLICLVFLIRAILPQQESLIAYMVGIAAITVISGLEYFWGMRHVLARRFRQAPVEAVRMIGLSLAVPVFYLPVMQRPGAPIYAILAVLALELVAGGLDNSLAQAGRVRSPVWDLLRSAIQAAAGLGMAWSLSRPDPSPMLAHVLANLAVVVTALDVFRRFRKNYDVFLDTAKPGTARADDSSPAMPDAEVRS